MIVEVNKVTELLQSFPQDSLDAGAIRPTGVSELSESTLYAILDNQFSRFYLKVSSLFSYS